MKIIVMDLDGTLLNSKKEISPLTKKKILQAEEKGHRAVLASGRTDRGTQNCASELELKNYGGYMISYNGAKITDCATGEILYSVFVPRDIPAKLYEIAKEFGAGLLTYKGGILWSAFEPDEYVKINASRNCMEIRVCENFAKQITFDVNKCLLCTSPERGVALESMLREKLGDELYISRSEDFFVEVMAGGVSKGDALMKLSELADFNMEDVICFGDSYNDMTMLKEAGTAVAMGNARDELKEIADYVTDSCDEDGIAKAIDRYII